MSRAEAKTNLQTRIDNNNKRKDFWNDVNGTYSIVNPSTYADGDWTGAGATAWITEWRTAHSDVVIDSDYNFPAESETNISNADYDQIFAIEERDLADRRTSVINTCNTRLAELQADLDDLVAGEEAGDVDQVISE